MMFAEEKEQYLENKMDHNLKSNSDNTIIKQAHNNNNNTWSPISLWGDFRQTDLTLILESWKFNVHKDVLEKSSDYFAAMFSSRMIESGKDVIELHLVNPEHFKLVIEGVYTGSLQLSNNNIFGVVQIVQMLQISPFLQSECIDFMRHNLISQEHCLELLYFCVELNIQELYSDVRRFCLAHFIELRHSSSFLKLSLAELYDYLSDKYLVVEDEVDVVEAIHKWFSANKSSVQINSHENDSFKAQVKKIVCACVYVKDIVGAHDVITDAVLFDGCLPRERFMFALAKRSRQEDVYMFWALLATTNHLDGLVDVVKLSLDTGNGIKFDSMTDIVEKPGFQLGSALCAIGPYVYLSGGGPAFGKTNWIRKIWKFDMSQPSSRWSIVGDLIDFRRSHTMVILENKLYIFGGFGKFRTKNSQLDSLDLLTGNWERLPPMPVHELNPATTVCDHKIFYICTDWQVYFFSTSTNDWSELTLWNTAPHRPPVEAKPVALFSVKTGDTDCFAVVTFTDSCHKVLLLHIEREAIKLYSSEESIASTTNIFTSTGSVLVNGNLVLFLTSEKVEDRIYGESETSHLQEALIFDPNKNCFRDLPVVQNVRKAQSIISLPYFPATFKMGTLDFR